MFGAAFNRNAPLASPGLRPGGRRPSGRCPVDDRSRAARNFSYLPGCARFARLKGGAKRTRRKQRAAAGAGRACRFTHYAAAGGSSRGAGRGVATQGRDGPIDKHNLPIPAAAGPESPPPGADKNATLSGEEQRRPAKGGNNPAKKTPKRTARSGQATATAETREGTPERRGGAAGGVSGGNRRGEPPASPCRPQAARARQEGARSRAQPARSEGRRQARAPAAGRTYDRSQPWSRHGGRAGNRMRWEHDR